MSSDDKMTPFLCEAIPMAEAGLLFEAWPGIAVIERQLGMSDFWCPEGWVADVDGLLLEAFDGDCTAISDRGGWFSMPKAFCCR